MTFVQCPACDAVFDPDDDTAERIIDRARIVKDPNGQYRVRAESRNGKLIMTSEQYQDVEWARVVAGDLGVPIVEQS